MQNEASQFLLPSSLKRYFLPGISSVSTDATRGDLVLENSMIDLRTQDLHPDPLLQPPGSPWELSGGAFRSLDRSHGFNCRVCFASLFRPLLFQSSLCMAPTAKHSHTQMHTQPRFLGMLARDHCENHTQQHQSQRT